MNPVAAVANSGTPWLTIAGGIPLLGAILIALLPVRFAKLTALLFTVADLVWVIVMATQFNTSGPTFQFTEEYSWIPQFGVHYALGVDGIALVLIGMTAVLMPVVILASWHDADESKRSPRMYFALMLALDTMMIGVFAATDVFLFYVFFEAMLIPMYFMIGSFGVGPRQYAAVKFLLYSLLGGLLVRWRVRVVPGGQDHHRHQHRGHGDQDQRDAVHAQRVVHAERRDPGVGLGELVVRPADLELDRDNDHHDERDQRERQGQVLGQALPGPHVGLGAVGRQAGHRHDHDRAEQRDRARHGQPGKAVHLEPHRQEQGDQHCGAEEHGQRVGAHEPGLQLAEPAR